MWFPLDGSTFHLEFPYCPQDRRPFITLFLSSQFALLTSDDLSFFSAIADPTSSSEPYYILSDIIYVFLLTSPHPRDKL